MKIVWELNLKKEQQVAGLLAILNLKEEN